jgi:hypothetical protein
LLLLQDLQRLLDHFDALEVELHALLHEARRDGLHMC